MLVLINTNNIRLTSERFKVSVNLCLLFVIVFSCLFGRSNGRPIPITLPSNQDGMMTTESSTSFNQNSGLSMYSRYWIAYVSVPLSWSTTGDNQSNSPTPDDRSSPSTDDKRDSSCKQSSNHRESISSPNQSQGSRQSSISSPDQSQGSRQSSISCDYQRLSPSLDNGDMMTYPSFSLAENEGPLSSDNDPSISSWQPLSFNDKDREIPMILFDEHGEMHKNYYASFLNPLINTNNKNSSDEADAT